MEPWCPDTPRGWPRRTLPCNVVSRLTGGLREVYTTVQASRVSVRLSRPETTPDGQLMLSQAMPLIAHRYRYMHTLSSSGLSQIVSAIDTFRHCPQADDGRTSPMVALKILNAQHWALGAQEFERMRRLWREFSRAGARPRITEPRAHFEEGLHFCIVFDLLLPLAALNCSELQMTIPSAFPSTATAGAPAIMQYSASMPISAVHPRPQNRFAALPTLPAHTPFPPACGIGTGSACTSSSMGSSSSLGDGSNGADGNVMSTGLPGVLGSGATRASGSTTATTATRAPRPRLDVNALRHAAVQLLGALAALHSHHVLHADLKPENIMVEPRRSAMRAGAGLARYDERGLGNLGSEGGSCSADRLFQCNGARGGPGVSRCF